MKLLIILFFVLNISVFSQDLIKGKVVNSSTDEPLYLANVSINDGTGTSTDKNGEFEIIVNLNSGGNLIISYIGYETKTFPLSSLSRNEKNIIKLESKIITSQTVLVKGSIGKEGVTPITFSKINRKDIEENYTTQDVPEYLSYMPSSTFYSESGNGLGYNYLSIRGFDQRRISVSINGIPQNDPEDHNVYWLDFPDLLESTELIQVQRGAGSGVIGYPAVGGSINIITSSFSDKPKFDIAASIGSYNTRKYSASFSSGLIDKKYSLYVKLSNTLSSGYKDKTWIDFKSFHVSAVRYDKNLTTQINIFGGPVADGLGYTGIAKFAVKDKELRKKNYSYWEADGDNYTYTVERRAEEIENFSQPHFELLNEYKFNDDVTFNSALFLVLGDGFFDYDGSWSVFYDDYFRLNQNGFDPTKFPTNALIRAQVENKQWGWIPRVSIKHNNGNLILGGELRIHNSVHWGSIQYAENLPEGVTPHYRYYYYEGGKDIFTFYAHEEYQLNEKINLLGELQFAYHNYSLNNEKYVNTDFKINDLFINPRLGFNYKFNNEVSGYGAFARVTREPRLKNYYDAAESSGGEVPQFEQNVNGIYNFENPLVKPETMNSIELGLNYNSDNLSLNANLFYMLFNDEIVKQGRLDRFGQPVTGNIDKTIHSGIELSGTAKVNNNLEITLNGTYSKNYISEGYEYLGGTDKINLADNRISGFPDLTFNAIVKFNYENFTTQFFAKYVGDFYSDNYDKNLGSYLNQFPDFTDYSDNKVDSYFTANLIASYETSFGDFFKKVKVYLQVNNLFDNLYAAYAIGKEFFPAAERNFLTGIKLGL